MADTVPAGWRSANGDARREGVGCPPALWRLVPLGGRPTRWEPASMTTPRRILLVALLLLIAAPAGASAATYCVSDADCVAAGGTDEAGDLAKGLADAQAAPGADRVSVGAGTFAGPFAYTDASAGNGVEIVGAGTASHLGAPGATVLTVAGG